MGSASVRLSGHRIFRGELIVQNFNDAFSALNGRSHKKVGNNTYLELLDDGSIGVRLHRTHVVTYHIDGSVTLKTGGWKTPTTKDRINTFAPIGIYQKRGYWLISGTNAEFQDGMTITPQMAAKYAD